MVRASFRSGCNGAIHAGVRLYPSRFKAFQVLLLLMRRQEQVVTKDDLMKAIWPATFVEEANLSRNIFLLRKALEESPQDHRYIVTVPGRGYRFAEDVRLVTSPKFRSWRRPI